MDEYKDYIDRHVQAQVELLSSKGYLNDKDSTNVIAENFKESLRVSLEDAMILTVIDAKPKTFDIPITVSFSDDRIMEIKLDFFFFYDKNILEINKMSIKEGEKKREFILPSTYDMPSAQDLPDLLDATELLRKYIRNSRISPESNDDNMKRRLN